MRNAGEADFTVDARDVLPRHCEFVANVRVTGLWRVKLAGVLLRLAARLIGSDVEVHFTPDPGAAPTG